MVRKALHGLQNKKILVLAGDIGGTKTNLGVFHQGKKRPVLQILETYPSGESSNLEDIISRFLEHHPVEIQSACFGIAGPVINGRCKTTNLPWIVSERRIKQRFGWQSIRLINDLAATAMAVPLMSAKDLTPLNKAKVQKRAPLAVVAPGTGLGQALLVVRDGVHIPLSSEGGHVDFAPTNEEEISLWRYLHREWGHVSVERIVSGPGLVSIYSWLKQNTSYPEPGYLTRMFQEMDAARVVTRAVLERNNPLCMKALDMFISILGAVAGNLALIGLTRGGVYLGGGIPPKILPRLKQGLFMKAFTDKGRFKGLLERIPVKVILNDQAALLGAAQYAFSD
ncbi:MAG: glucokinase [Deltaproteobacteria bacterium]|nr:glucokinase [Deltaproteobacteria bacterium]